jgi:NAD-dependent dihydropyrimidine dehydrogenase PreA subunit
MKYDSCCTDKAIEEVLPHKCLTFEESLQRAFLKISQNEVVSTWMDSWLIEGSNADIHKYIQVPEEGCLRDQQIIPITIPKEEVINRTWSIGGKSGWYGLNWAWKLRASLIAS